MKKPWSEKHQKPRGCYWRRNLTALIPDDLVSVAFACHLQLCLWVGWWWKGAWWSAHLNSRAQRRAQLNSLESRGGPWFLMTFVCQLLIAWKPCGSNDNGKVRSKYCAASLEHCGCPVFGVVSVIVLCVAHVRFEGGMGKGGGLILIDFSKTNNSKLVD